MTRKSGGSTVTRGGTLARIDDAAENDETAMVLVDHPEQVRKQEYKKELAFLTRPGLAALPFPGSIILYKKGEGFPDFDLAKVTQLMAAVCAKVQATILEVFRHWQMVR